MKLTLSVLIVVILLVFTSCQRAPNQLNTSTPAEIVPERVPSDHNLNATLGLPSIKQKIRSNITGFAGLMSDPAGFAQPVGSFQAVVDNVNMLTDGNVSNDELNNIILYETRISRSLGGGLALPG